jgi:hypothetical protein
MGWQDRDWAKWTDEERDRYLGGTTVSAPGRPEACGRASSRRTEATLLAVLVSLAVSLAGWHFHLFRLPALTHPAVVVPTTPVVYGTGLAQNGASQMTCTAMATDARGGESCTAWTILGPGQRAVQATPLPAGTACPAVVADQRSGRWMCSAATTS